MNFQQFDNYVLFENIDRFIPVIEYEIPSDYELECQLCADQTWKSETTWAKHECSQEDICKQVRFQECQTHVLVH